MLRLLRVYSLAIVMALLPAAAFAQRGGHRGFHGGGGFHGGFHRGFGGGGFRHFEPRGFHGPRFTFGFGLGLGYPFGFGYPFSFGYYPYNYYYYPWGYGYPYSYPYSYSYPYPCAYCGPNVTVIYPPSAISEEQSETGAYGTSAGIKYGKSFHPTYLIALKNGAVQTAIAYWSEDGSLHYLDAAGRQMTVPMSQVDRRRSQELNRERGVSFGLPDSPGDPRAG
jgi:hypothetical protein